MAIALPGGDMWVRSEYAGELAVLMTWLCGLTPWAITWISDGDFNGIFFWFHPVNFLFTPGIELPGERPLWVWEFLGFAVFQNEVFVTYFWLLGTMLFGSAFVFSLVYYLDESRVESLRIDPIRVLGILLFASGISLGVAFSVLWQNHAGLTIPIGVVIQLAFGAILLKTERVDRP